LETVKAVQSFEAFGSTRALPSIPLSHNLNGQRLGRKGRDTRDRIIAAAQDVLNGPREVPVTLSAVAREAGLGMTSLYNYFSDLSELLLAVLDSIMVKSEAAYVAEMKTRWPDEKLYDHCFGFLTNFHSFWDRNSRLLHLRNSMAEQLDARMMRHRVACANPIIMLIVHQMGREEATYDSPAYGMATVLYTGIERVITVATDIDMQNVIQGSFSYSIDHYLQPEARLLELGIREFRGMP
jgi:AcrR family transcriptional regulator